MWLRAILLYGALGAWIGCAKTSDVGTGHSGDVPVSSSNPTNDANARGTAPGDAAVGPTVGIVLTSADGNALLATQPSLHFMDGQSDPTGAIELTITSASALQVIEGFGAALTDSSARLIPTPLLRELYAPPPGLNLSLVHVDIGSGEFSSAGDWTDDGFGDGLPPDPNFTRFELSDGPERHYTFGRLDDILAANPNVRMLGVPWSAPSWMKTTGSMAGGTLTPGNEDLMAHYLLLVVQGFADRGYHFYAIAPQNQPETDSAAAGLRFPSSLLPASREASFVRDTLGPLLQVSAPGVKIFTYEGDWSGVSHPNQVLSDAGARAYISGVGFHCDSGDPNAQDQIVSAYPEQHIWVSRCGRTQATDFATDLEWYGNHLLVGAMRHGASALMMYNIGLDANNGQTNGGCLNCRPIFTLATPVRRNVEYYVLGQAAPYIQVGARRVASTDTQAANVANVAFVNPDGSRSLILVNSSDAVVPVAIHDGTASVVYAMPAHALATLFWTAP